MNIWHDVPAGDNIPEELNVIIEVPKGSQNKYELDKETGLVMLDRVLYGAHHYPADYGMVPQTYCPDNDPLDALVLVSNATAPGVLIKARPIAVMTMVDGGEQDDKLLCVPMDDPRLAHLNDLSDVPEGVLNEITNFFETYKTAQKKEVIVEGWHDKAKALEIINASIEGYKEKFGK